jgi:hypothetical protein
LTRAASIEYRRYRKNQADGVGIAPTPYDDVVLGYLIKLGWLSEDLANDRREVGAAIARAVTRN